jgi:ParB-like chromosome segregation protein Spo0J
MSFTLDEMKLEKIDINNLIFDPANVRKHGEKNIKAIKGSLSRWKQTKPILVNMENIVIAGNGTLGAMIELGAKEVYVVRKDVKGAELAALSIADNRTAELATWDDDALGIQLQALGEDGFDLESIGYDQGDLAEFKSDFLPGDENDQGQLDEKQKKICPHCGMEL